MVTFVLAVVVLLAALATAYVVYTRPQQLRLDEYGRVVPVRRTLFRRSR